jgi:hypothetical protein
MSVSLTAGAATAGAASSSSAQLRSSAGVSTPATPRKAAKAAAQPRRGTNLRPANVRPSPDFTAYCGSHSPNNPRCISLELKAIHDARRAQGFHTRRMVLPSNYASLSFAEQTFVVTNLERVDRGLRPFTALVPALNSRAAGGARDFSDPWVSSYLTELLGVHEWSSIWAEDYGPLAADYDWMYDDGYRGYGPTVEHCHSKNGSGCWIHRDIIIAGYGAPGHTLIAGAATAGHDALSVAEVLSAGNVRPSATTYTWSAALRHGADGRAPHAWLRDTAH